VEPSIQTSKQNQKPKQEIYFKI